MVNKWPYVHITRTNQRKFQSPSCCLLSLLGVIKNAIFLFFICWTCCLMVIKVEQRKKKKNKEHALLQIRLQDIKIKKNISILSTIFSNVRIILTQLKCALCWQQQQKTIQLTIDTDIKKKKKKIIQNYLFVILIIFPMKFTQTYIQQHQPPALVII